MIRHFYFIFFILSNTVLHEFLLDGKNIYKNTKAIHTEYKIIKMLYGTPKSIQIINRKFVHIEKN